MSRKLQVTFASTLIAFTGLFAAADQRDSDPIFSDHEILDVQLSAPFERIMDVRSVKDEDAEPGKFTYVDTDGTVVEFDVAVRARGMFRRDKSICTFAPLLLNFKKGQTAGTLFDHQNKVKLVTHCKNGSARYQQTVITEYLAYQVLNLLTDISFRARLLKIQYTDSENPDSEKSSYAFLIEHKKRLSKHLDAPKLEIVRVPLTSLDEEQTNLASLFQYFIGNTDFSPVAGPTGDVCCHNYELLGTLGKTVYTITYDFDQSGIVNAPHAVPNADLGARFAAQRIYRGRCDNNEQLPTSIAHFQERRSDIVALIESQPGLEQKTRKRLLRYTEDFYKIIDNPKSVEKKLINKFRE